MSEFTVKDADAIDRTFGATGLGATGNPFFSIPADFFLEVAKGNVPKHSVFIVRGFNGDIDIGVAEDIWSVGGTLVYLTSAETMEIVSTSTDDDGSPLGNGARTMLIEGVDDTGAAISETITLNGTTIVTTSNSYLRVNRMIVLTVGTSTFNDGTITATSTTSSTIQSQILANKSIDYGSHYTVPLGKTAFILQTELNSSKIGGGGGNPLVEFQGLIRPFGGPFIEFFTKELDTAVTDIIDNTRPFPNKVDARSDAKFVAITDANNTQVRIRAHIILIDD